MMNNMFDDGGYAFPVPMVYDGTVCDTVNERGMSLRDYFAAQVIDMASHDVTEPSVVAARAYRIADAMIMARQSGRVVNEGLRAASVTGGGLSRAHGRPIPVGVREDAAAALHD